jgi:cobalamin biosynthesis protein CobD/CbiB
MSFDVWIVGFGLSRVLIELKMAESPIAYSAMVVAALLDAYLLYVFFKAKSQLKTVERENRELRELKLKELAL